MVAVKGEETLMDPIERKAAAKVADEDSEFNTAIDDDEPTTEELVESTGRFDNESRRLIHKFRSLRNELDQLKSRLQRGDRPGDRLAGIGYEAYKVRLPNLISVARQKRRIPRDLSREIGAACLTVANLFQD